MFIHSFMYQYFKYVVGGFMLLNNIYFVEALCQDFVED